MRYAHLRGWKNWKGGQDGGRGLRADKGEDRITTFHWKKKATKLDKVKKGTCCGRNSLEGCPSIGSSRRWIKVKSTK